MNIISNLSLNDKENLIERLDRILDWIKSCDTKASIVIAGIGVTLTVLTSSNSLMGLKKVMSSLLSNVDFSNFLYLVFLVGALGCTLLGVVNLILVLVPRLNKFASKINDTKSNSLYYFGKISEIDYNSFKQSLEREINTMDEIEDLMSQIYINSNICAVKYNYYRRGIIFSFSGVVAFIVLYLIGLFLFSIGGF